MAAILLAAAAAASPCGAQPSLEDALLSQRQIITVMPSPDGRRAAFVVEGPTQAEKPASRIWLLETHSGSAHPLAAAGEAASAPRWSPDGRTLAFLSQAPGEGPQVTLLQPDAPEATRLTAVKGGVRGFSWAPDGRAIAYARTASEPQETAATGGALVASRQFRASALDVVDVASRDARDVLAGRHLTVGMFAWTPDGKRLVATVRAADRPEDPVNRLVEIRLADGRLREIAKLRGVLFSNLSVSPDGRTATYLGSDDGPIPHDLFLQPLDGGPARNLTGRTSRARIDRPVADPVWVGPHRVTFTVQERLGAAVYTLDAESGEALRLRSFPDHAVTAFAAAGDMLLYAKTSAVQPPELWSESKGVERQLTELHAGLPPLWRPEVVRYHSFDGLEIEGHLYRPSGGAGPYPLVVLVHPGPARRWSAEVNDWAQLLAANGMAVLAPNIRGSSGYGEAFLQANRSDWGGGDFRDVMAGVDALVARRIADPDRLGIAGWSYGGHMSAWAATQTQRFKAAVASAPVLDLAGQWGTEEAAIVPYDTWYLGVPWGAADDFARMSPLSHVHKAAAPILLMVGAADTINPVPQNWQFYRALRMNGVRTELVVYPGEGHRLRDEAHVRDQWDRMVRWLKDGLQGP